MQVVIESIDQRYPLEGDKEVITTLNIRLPNGQHITTVVQPEMAERLIGAAVPEPPKQDESLPITDGAPEVFGDGETDEAEQLIDWTELPDDSLAPQMKKVLFESEAPHVMPASELAALVDKIGEHLMNQAAQRARATTPGKVQRVQAPRPRMVPKDELGYPMVPHLNNDRDPGEVALSGSDEDGVPQL